MGLREIRTKQHMTQRELAQRSGVNFRSLQDYEQGHKKIASASGDILLRLSTVLGCSVEELLLGDQPTEAPLMSQNTMPPEAIRNVRFYSSTHQIAGRFVCDDHHVGMMFYYNGKQHTLPFHAIFKYELIEWLKEAAVLQLEHAVEELSFRESECEWMQ